MRSLLAALVVGLVLSLAVVFAVQWTAVRAALDAGARQLIVDELEQDAEELFSSLEVMPGGAATLALTHFDPVFLSPGSGRYYQVAVDGSVKLRSPSLAGQWLPAPTVGPGRRTVTEAPGPNRQALIMSASGYDFGGRPVTIAVAADFAPVEAEFGAVLARYTQVSLAMFALLVVLQVVIVRVALAPLSRVRADVARLERGEIAQLREAVPAEVLPLVREVNRMLALVGERLRRSRESLGNLAHALKAPLTVLTHMASDERVRAHPALAAQMDEQLGMLRARIDSELRRARAAGGRASGPAVDLRSEIEALAATLRKIHRERELDIECRIDRSARFHGDREDLLEICGNLLDNACKWARLRIVVSARNGNGPVLTVEDDGPGCSPEDLARLAQRGMRLDETTEGHGLGLAIVRGIAASYGASLRFDRSEELGGFRATLAFPPTRPGAT